MLILDDPPHIISMRGQYNRPGGQSCRMETMNCRRDRIDSARRSVSDLFSSAKSRNATSSRIDCNDPCSTVSKEVSWESAGRWPFSQTRGHPSRGVEERGMREPSCHVERMTGYDLRVFVVRKSKHAQTQLDAGEQH